LEQALALQQDVLGRNHLQVGDTLADLGTVQVSLGKYAKAERMLRRAAIIYTRQGAAEDSHAVSVLQELQQVYQLRGNSAAADALTSQLSVVSKRASLGIQPGQGISAELISLGFVIQ